MFVFITNMITPINFHQNTYKLNNVNRQIRPDIAFRGTSDVAEFQKRIEEEIRTNNANSQSIYESIQKGDFKSASQKIEDFGFDFNPNWTAKNGVPLLASLYFLPNFRAKIRGAFNEKHKSDTIVRITSHPEFQPDRIFYVYKNGEEKEYTYVDVGVENEDVMLLQLLAACGGTLDKYSDEELSDLEMKAQNNKTVLYTLMTQLCDGSAKHAQIRELEHEVKSLKRKLKAASKAQITTSEAPDQDSKITNIDHLKANISKNIPASLDKVGGMTEAKKAIENYIIKPWGASTMKLLRDNNIDMPNGFLMYGPPGCGKTYVAKVIAKQTGFPMYEVELGSIGNSYAYTVTSNLNKIFKQLENQYKKTKKPSILFLDEIDSVAASRKLSRSDWKRDEINTLIALLNNASEKGIIVIGATNFIDNVDEAVLRPGRFDKKIEIPLPDKAERKEILEKLIMNKKITQGLLPFVDELSDITNGKSCSEIAASINVCGRNAIYENKNSVAKEDFIKAMKEIEYEDKRNGRRIVGFSCD